MVHRGRYYWPCLLFHLHCDHREKYIPRQWVLKTNRMFYILQHGPCAGKAAVLCSVDWQSVLQTSGRAIPVLPLAQVDENADFCCLSRCDSPRSSAVLTLVSPVLLISKIVSHLYLIFINFSKVLMVKAGKVWASGECSSRVPSSSTWPADHLTPSDTGSKASGFLEFRASLVYTGSSRVVRATQRNPALKTQTIPPPKKYKQAYKQTKTKRNVEKLPVWPQDSGVAETVRSQCLWGQLELYTVSFQVARTA